jgi:hypothetical protein
MHIDAWQIAPGIVFQGCEIDDLAISFVGGHTHVAVTRATAARGTVATPHMAIELEDIRIRELRIGGGEVAVAELDAAVVRLCHDDLRRAGTGQAAGDGSDRRFDLGFADHLEGKLEVDLTTDATVPLIGRRRATHKFRIPIHDGAIDIKELEHDLSALEDAVLDFVFEKGALHLVKDIPLVPFDRKTLLYWPLAEGDLELAADNRVRISRLADYHTPRSGSGRGKGNGGKSSVALRELHFDNIAADLSLTGPATVDLAGGRIHLGEVSGLRAQGEIHHDAAEDTADETLVELESADWSLRIEGLDVGGRRLDVDRLAVDRLEGAAITFHDVAPAEMRATVHGLHLERVHYGM